MAAQVGKYGSSDIVSIGIARVINQLDTVCYIHRNKYVCFVYINCINNVGKMVTDTT